MKNITMMRKNKMKQVIVMRTDLNMRKGKMVAQGAHASMAAVFKGSYTIRYSTSWWSRFARTLVPPQDYSTRKVIPYTPELEAWFDGSFTKICLGINNEKSLDELYENAVDAGIRCALITDSGRTEFQGNPTKTCIAIGPAPSEEIDKITGHLKLL
jgi:PTH2 family peptidyl-tRNA hydrolase